MSDYEVFRPVTGRRKTRMKYKQFAVVREPVNEVDLERQLKRVLENPEFKTFLKEVLHILETIQAEQKIVRLEKVVCFGIGSFSSSIPAIHQLALILQIQRHFGVAAVDCYDPILGASERRILEQYGWHMMPENCEGKYPLIQAAIIYLPHCPKQLTNNFLWQNWDATRLSQTILICNSFSALVNNMPKRFLDTEAEYILKISDYMQEVSLDGKYFLAEVFNDTSVHYLANDRCSLIDEAFWVRKDAPTYLSSELITRELERKILKEPT